MIDQPRGRFPFGAKLGIVGAVALEVRVMVVLLGKGNDPPNGDGVWYHGLANQLADGVGFVNPHLWEAGRVKSETAAHPPLYPMFLAVFSKVGLDSPLSHRLVSCLLGVAAVVVIGLVGREVASERAGLIAAGLAAVYPNLWISDSMIHSESLFVLLVALVLLVSYRLWARPSIGGAAALGLLLGLAALTRPEALMLFVILAVPLAVVMPLDEVGQRVRLLAVTGVVGVVVLAPWIGFNMARFDEPTLLVTGTGPVLTLSNCDSTYYGDLIGYWDARCLDHTFYFLVAFPDEDGDTGCDCAPDDWRCVLDRCALGDESVMNSRGMDLGFEYIGDHAARVPVVVAARAARALDVYAPFQNVELNDRFEMRGLWPSRFALASWWLLVPFAVYGLVVLRQRGVTLVPFVSTIAASLVAVALAIGITRYRVPIEVCVVVLAGIAVDRLLARRGESTQSPPATVGVASSAEGEATPEP